MKSFFVSLFALVALFHASAQVSLDLSFDQDQFLPNEPIRLTVKVTNTSGQKLHLGVDPDWLTFAVESADGFIVVKDHEVPVVEPFDLESSQMAIKHVDLQPCFELGRVGRYKVTAAMRVKAWGLIVNSTSPAHFDVIHGAELWSQAFGVVLSTNAPPEPRKYSLIKANYLHAQLRLYVQVSSGDGGAVYKVTALGPLVSFSMPESQVDRVSELHVLWQTAAQSFSYTVVAPDGSILSQDIYDNFGSRPRLSLDTNGDVVVVGGVRRPRPDELPAVRMPAPAPINPPKS